jgi:predicted phosphate transport protein (TIGR00153 family)
MFSKIMPKNIGFFDLFERHVASVLESGITMQKLLDEIGTPSVGGYVRRIEELEHECDNVTHMTVDLIRRTFISPFDREETRTLISALDDVIDLVQAAAHRVELYEINEVPDGVRQLCAVLVKAQREMVTLVGYLREMKKHGKTFSTICKEINRLENEGDRFHRAGLAMLFHNKTEPLELMKLKELYEVLECAVDSCEDVSNIIEGLFIEHVG